jgi:type II secretory pathway component PulF
MSIKNALEGKIAELQVKQAEAEREMDGAQLVEEAGLIIVALIVLIALSIFVMPMVANQFNGVANWLNGVGSKTMGKETNS